MGKYYSHLTLRQRLKMEACLTARWSIKDIAHELGVHISTIYREKSRGRYWTREYNCWKDIIKYSADIAEEKYRKNLLGKGKEIKIKRDPELMDYLEKKIGKDKYSPKAALGEIRRRKIRFQTTICVGTLYNYIAKGVFKGLSPDNLPVKKKKKKDKKKEKNHIHKRIFGDGIEKRAKSVESRKEFGHWEMDTVKGAMVGRCKACLLVLTERKTRYEIIKKLQSGTAEEVNKALKAIKADWGYLFPEIFRTITMDNGVEFRCYNDMLNSTGNSVKMYFCHPYSSWERGTNETTNKLIRRWWPKGTIFDDKSPEAVKALQVWINDYPRGIFKYRSAKDIFEKELAKLKPRAQ